MPVDYAGTAGCLVLGGFFLLAGIANLVTPGAALMAKESGQRAVMVKLSGAKVE